MSKPKWRYDEANQTVYCDDSEDSESLLAVDVDEEEGRLIAAAPALLKALQDAPEPPMEGSGHEDLGDWQSYAMRTGIWYRTIRAEALKLTGGGE